MQLIPVIDLKDGLVVQAVGGLRDQYQPIHQHSRLTQTSDVESVIKGYRQLFPFKSFYLADLNAIMGLGNHQLLINRLLDEFSDCEFWIDDGRQQADVSPYSGYYKAVLGSEVQQQPLLSLNSEQILSLDFRNNRFLGDVSWLERDIYWPKNVIVMNLDCVGRNQGPDFQRLEALIDSHPDTDFVAAGGVRNDQDLLRLEVLGVKAVLLASALHQNRVSIMPI